MSTGEEHEMTNLADSNKLLQQIIREMAGMIKEEEDLKKLRIKYRRQSELFEFQAPTSTEVEPKPANSEPNDEEKSNYLKKISSFKLIDSPSTDAESIENAEASTQEPTQSRRNSVKEVEDLLKENIKYQEIFDITVMTVNKLIETTTPENFKNIETTEKTESLKNFINSKLNKSRFQWLLEKYQQFTFKNIGLFVIIGFICVGLNKLWSPNEEKLRSCMDGIDWVSLANSMIDMVILLAIQEETKKTERFERFLKYYFYFGLSMSNINNWCRIFIRFKTCKELTFSCFIFYFLNNFKNNGTANSTMEAQDLAMAVLNGSTIE
uniref:Uncharacterized protein n=1 Tax=Panagrolaimus sp. JU765 TaxID=591449 RepID=A0AC34QA14_9BILA